MIEKQRLPAGMEREREKEGGRRKLACSVLRRPISQDQLTLSVMLGFSLCCFSKVACTDFYSNLSNCIQALETWRWTLVSVEYH